MQELLLKMAGGRLRGGGVFAGFYGTGHTRTSESTDYCLNRNLKFVINYTNLSTH